MKAGEGSPAARGGRDSGLSAAMIYVKTPDVINLSTDNKYCFPRHSHICLSDPPSHAYPILSAAVNFPGAILYAEYQ